MLAGSYAFKVPSFRHGTLYFVMGMLGNLLERDIWRRSHHPMLAPLYVSAPFGLLNVYRRYRTLLRRTLTKAELATLPFINFDNNGHNIALEDGRLVVIDYGNLDAYFIAEV